MEGEQVAEVQPTVGADRRPSGPLTAKAKRRCTAESDVDRLISTAVGLGSSQPPLFDECGDANTPSLGESDGIEYAQNLRV